MERSDATGAADRRRLGVAVPWRGEHRLTRAVARGGGRCAVDARPATGLPRLKLHPVLPPPRADSSRAISSSPSTISRCSASTTLWRRCIGPTAMRRCATPYCGSAPVKCSTCASRRFRTVRAACTSSSPRLASSRSSSAAASVSADRAIRQRFTSSGSPSRSSASSPSRSADGSIVSTGCSSGQTRFRSSCCRRCSCISPSSFPIGRGGGPAAPRGVCWRRRSTFPPSRSGSRASWRWPAAMPTGATSSGSLMHWIGSSSSTWRSV